jgi:hypothetical protein
MNSTRKNPLNRRGSAILDLAVGCSYNSEADGTIIEWLTPDIPQPSEADIEAKIAEYEIEWNAQEYSRNREAEYPSIADLVVALYDTDDKSAVEAKRAEVKAKYPKPE